MKICSKCKLEKSTSQFQIDKSKKDGLSSSCKNCRSSHYQNNKNQILLNAKGYYQKNKDSILKKNKQYRVKNSEKIKAQIRQYHKDNCVSIYEKKLIYIAYKKVTDINWRLRSNLRSRLSNAIKKEWKSGSAVKDLGCSVEFLKQHLESKFQPGMTWSNYGKYGWHIDHIMPLSSFDLTDRDQLLKACHYTNLQPLWAKENLKKGNFVTKEGIYG